MILIGHPLIPHQPFYRVDTKEDIAQTPSNATLFFEFDPEMASYCTANALKFALHVKNVKELILGNALGACYFIVDKSLVLQAQKIADEYLFDAKVLLYTEDENDIEFSALHSIDGVLFQEGIV